MFGLIIILFLLIRPKGVITKKMVSDMEALFRRQTGEAESPKE